MEYKITVPVTDGILENLKIGDTVLLSGTVYTARDQAHLMLLELINNKKALPFDLSGSAIYYVGPTPERPGQIIGSAGPTTSGRMDSISPLLIANGNKIMIGKGIRNNAVKEAIKAYKAVYLAAIGGAGALMASSIKKAEIIAFPELGCEAIRKLTVENMPLTVVIDTLGNDLYEQGPKDYLNTDFKQSSSVYCVCPVCGKTTFSGIGDICPVCGWEHDSVQEHDPTFTGGANRQSLNQAKITFKKRKPK